MMVDQVSCHPYPSAFMKQLAIKKRRKVHEKSLFYLKKLVVALQAFI
jgi:hypothetical protein